METVKIAIEMEDGGVMKGYISTINGNFTSS